MRQLIVHGDEKATGKLRHLSFLYSRHAGYAGAWQAGVPKHRRTDRHLITWPEIRRLARRPSTSAADVRQSALNSGAQQRVRRGDT